MIRPDYSDKESVRNYFLSKRRDLDRNTVIRKSKEIRTKLFETAVFKKAKTIHTYVSIVKQNEVLTQPIIEAAFNDEKCVVVPKMVKQAQLRHYQIDTLSELKVNTWGVPEPISDSPYPIEDIDLVIVPMVVGDRFKNRIGYGKGYYDRFLSKINAFKIGLLFQSQLSEVKLPAEEFDIKLDMLLTESEEII